MTGTVTLHSSNKRESKISAKKCNFSSPKSVESKEANYLVDKTFPFVNMNQ